jgi:hypothetical protein
VARESTSTLVKKLRRDASTPEGLDAVIAKNLFITFLAKFVHDAAEIPDGILKS